jgi:hypothetical protein
MARASKSSSSCTASNNRAPVFPGAPSDTFRMLNLSAIAYIHGLLLQYRRANESALFQRLPKVSVVVSGFVLDVLFVFI